jgi:hypothetical protein
MLGKDFTTETRRHEDTEDIPVEVLFHASLISLNLARLVSP